MKKRFGTSSMSSTNWGSLQEGTEFPETPFNPFTNLGF